MKELIVLGANGHAKVAIATAQALGHTVIAAYDDDASKHGSEILGISIRGTIQEGIAGQRPALITIGSNRVRERLGGADVEWATLIHPSAIVHESVTIGVGSVVFARCVIQPDSQVGRHAILNTACHVDHDCVIGNWAHIAPGAHLCGGVQIGNGTLAGVGSSFIPCVSVGNWSTVGAGAAIVENWGDDLLLMGVPARPR